MEYSILEMDSEKPKLVKTNINRRKLKIKRLNKEKRNATFNMSINMNIADDAVKSSIDKCPKRKKTTLETILKAAQYPINMYSAYMLVNQFGISGILTRSLLDKVLNYNSPNIENEQVTNADVDNFLINSFIQLPLIFGSNLFSKYFSK